MPFIAIPGRFHVAGYSPDGDSVRFGPDDPALLARLDGPPAKINSRGHVQLRIEAIDALETHFTPKSVGGTYHQPLKAAGAARSALLDFLGIGDVVWSANGREVRSAGDGVRGYILARSVEKNRRPVSFVFAGDPPEAAGSAVFLTVERIRHSYNHLALRQGHAYATFYTGLFHDLRDELTAATAAARSEGLSIHAIDRTLGGFDVPDLQGLQREFGIMPKLFRRIVEYVANTGTIDGFKAKMEEYAEPVLDLTTTNFTHFDTFILQTGANLRLTRHPEQLVFDAMPERGVDAFARIMRPGRALSAAEA